MTAYVQFSGKFYMGGGLVCRKPGVYKTSDEFARFLIENHGDEFTMATAEPEASPAPVAPEQPSGEPVSPEQPSEASVGQSSTERQEQPAETVSVQEPTEPPAEGDQSASETAKDAQSTDEGEPKKKK